MARKEICDITNWNRRYTSWNIITRVKYKCRDINHLILIKELKDEIHLSFVLAIFSTKIANAKEFAVNTRPLLLVMREISIFAKPKHIKPIDRPSKVLRRQERRNCIGSIQRPLLSPRELSAHLGGKMMAVTRKLPVPVIPRVIRIRASTRMVFAGHSTFFTPPHATCWATRISLFIKGTL